MAMVFDANLKPVATVHRNDTIILYAAGLGPVDSSGKVVDPVDVYLGERKAQVQFAGLAPGFAGVYQLNVTAPTLATDRIYLRSGGWQSNIVYMGIQTGTNTMNTMGSIDGAVSFERSRLSNVSMPWAISIRLVRERFVFDHAARGDVQYEL
jgi:hypothetical protein